MARIAGLLVTALTLGLGAVVHSEEQTAQPPKKAVDLFGSDKMWTIHVKLTAKAWEEMQPTRGGMGFGKGGKDAKGKFGGPFKLFDKKAGEGKDQVISPFGYDFTYVKGVVEFEKAVFEDVGVRFRGNSSYQQSKDGLRRPFKLDFNHYVEGQKLSGLPSLALNNNAMDPSQLHDALGYWVYRQAKVPAPRTAFAKLYLTIEGKSPRQLAGLYTVVEPFNKTFLKDRFGSKEGLLLKPERAQGLAYLGENWARYEERYQPKTEATPEQKKRLIAFTKLIHQGTEAAFRKEIGNYLDIDDLLRFVACTSLIVNQDSFLGLGHNYIIYLDPTSNKFLFMPWDLNLAFGGMGFGGGADQQTQLSVLKPWQGQNKLLDRLFAMEEHKTAYRKLVKEMTDTFFTTSKLNAEVDVMQKTVREPAGKFGGPFGKGDPFGKGGMGPPGIGGGGGLKQFLAKRVEQVNLQLEGKAKGVEPAGFGKGGPFGKDKK